MSLTQVPYHFASCAGKTSNLRSPKCQIEGPGSFDENEAADAAVAEGWLLGPKNYCPAHKAQATPATEPAADKPAGRRRGKAPALETVLETPVEASNG